VNEMFAHGESMSVRRSVSWILIELEILFLGLLLLLFMVVEF